MNARPEPPAATDPQELRQLAELLGAARYAEVEARAVRLLRIHPRCGLAWKALGTARLMTGRDALAALHQATLLMADDGAAHYTLGVALQALGQFDQALASYRRALALSPADSAALRQLGRVLVSLGRYAEAAHCQGLLLDIHPDCAEAHLDRGNIFKLLGKPGRAMGCYRRAIELKPEFAEAHYNLGVVLHEAGRHHEAADCFRRALAASPDYAQAHLNLGNALKRLGQLEEAAASYRAALQSRPDSAEAYLDLGNVVNELGHGDQAIACYRQALSIHPGFVEAHFNLGNSFKDRGRIAEGIDSFRRAISIDPDFFAAHDNLLYSHTLMFSQDPQTMLADALHFGQRVARRARPCSDWPNTPIAARTLRVGLVSGDFRHHPVAYFLESVLGQFKSGAVRGIEVVAYSNCPRRDAATERIKGNCHAWRSVARFSDEHLVRQIRTDAIDILIDLSAHTEHNRLPMFAWKPAPVQLSWLGWQATTGVAAIDYILADRWTVLPGEEDYLTETVWRLPETLWCLTPPELDAGPSALPALATGRITFACFNRLEKINDEVVALWARVLRSVPGSLLLLKTPLLKHDETRQRMVARFALHGIGRDRLILEGPSSRADHLAAYRRVDIALDPFPYPGATTSVEGLLMGVPVITLGGERFASRQGVSFVMNAGLPDWIAVDRDDYVARAVAHASDLTRLAALRSSLRERVLASPLCDAPRFARHLEAALRGMWHAWCARR